jgi:primary-amine oxidase
MDPSSQVRPHPLSQLSHAETNLARDILLECHPSVVIDFRETFLQEPPKAEVVKFLDHEHSDSLKLDTPRPARLAKIQYDVIGGSKIPEFHESIIDLDKRARVGHEVISIEHHASLTLYVSREK